jgi:predicted PurR-regulated permease PerM
MLIFLIVHQQVESHLPQPVTMSRAVSLSALEVLVSVLIGVELLGFLCALPAIPIAGARRVVNQDGDLQLGSHDA